jgi:hypothetical protein
MDTAKYNPEIVDKLSYKLIEAKDESDVADALMDAKVQSELIQITDPVQRKQI